MDRSSKATQLLTIPRPIQNFGSFGSQLWHRVTQNHLQTGRFRSELWHRVTCTLRWDTVSVSEQQVVVSWSRCA